MASPSVRKVYIFHIVIVSSGDTLTIRKLIRFGGMETKLLFWLEENEKSIFTFAQARAAIGGTVASAKNVLKRLKKKKRVIPLQKGIYLFAPLKSGKEGHWSEDAFLVAKKLAGKENYYIGFLSAMNHYGMTEQIPVIVHVVLTRQKKTIEAVGAKFVFTKKKELGEITMEKIHGEEIAFSSIEQTIIDGLAFPQYCLGISEVAKAINASRKAMNFEKLLEMAKHSSTAVRGRLGYILEQLGLKTHAKKLEGKFTGFAWLDPHLSKKNLSYSKKWGLKINMAEPELLDFLEVH